MATLNINGRAQNVDAPDDTPLLWVIRERLQMTGTKFGCGAGLCGACTVHVNGEAVRSCQTALGRRESAASVFTSTCIQRTRSLVTRESSPASSSSSAAAIASARRETRNAWRRAQFRLAFEQEPLPIPGASK